MSSWKKKIYVNYHIKVYRIPLYLLALCYVRLSGSRVYTTDPVASYVQSWRCITFDPFAAMPTLMRKHKVDLYKSVYDCVGFGYQFPLKSFAQNAQ